MDERIISWIVSIRGASRFTDNFFAFTASYSSWFFAAAYFFFVLFVFSFRKQTRLELLSAAVILPAGALFLNLAIRALVPRQRPFEVMDGLAALVPHSPGNSFPSNHAAAGFAVACFIYMVKPQAGLVFMFLSLIVSFSRVYSGLHYPTDVAAGIVLAAVIAVAAARAMKPAGVFIRKHLLISGRRRRST